MGHPSSVPTNPDAPTQDLGTSLAKAEGSDPEPVRMGHMVGTKHKLDIVPEPTRRSKRLQTTSNN